MEVCPGGARDMQVHIMRVADDRTGRLQTVGELGASATGYGARTDNGTASGVGRLVTWGEVYMGFVQWAAMELQYARMRRRVVFEQEAARYALGEKERRLRDSNAAAEDRTTSYAIKRAGKK